MRTKEKSLVVGIVVVVGIILLALFFVDKPLAIGGTSTLALSKAKLESSNPYLSGEVWVLTFSANSLGQSYFGNFDPLDVEDATTGSLRSKRDFSVEVNYEDTKCKYPISGTSLDPIKDVRKIEYTYIPFIDPCTEDEAKAKGINNVIIYGKYGWSLTCFAVGYDTKSVVKRIDNPDISADYTINIDVVGGQSASKTFNTLEGTTSGPIGSFAYSVWNGNFDTGKSCPSQASYLGAYVNGVWRVINSNSYDSYKNEFDKISTFYFGGGASDKTQLENLISNINTKGNSAKSSVSFGSIENPGDLSNARVIYTSTTPLQFPVTTLYLKVDSIGIYTPVPNFKINSASSNCFKTGTEGAISFELANSGETGGFTAYATCSGVFSATRNTQGTVSAGSTSRYSIPLSATASSEQKSSCVLTVESTGNTVTKSVDVCVQPQVTCDVEPGKKFCGYEGGLDVIKTCSADGATSTVVERCTADEECKNAKCFAKGTPGNWWSDLWSGIGNFFSDLFGGLFDILTITKWIIIVVASIFVFISSNGLLESVGRKFRFKLFRNYPWLVYLIAGAITIAVGYVLYLFIGSFWFWVIVAGVVVYNIVFSQLSLFSNIRRITGRK
jgi:hypothetical protein